MKYKIFSTIFLFLVFFSILPVYAANCIMCGQQISGRYANTQKGPVCESCVRAYQNRQQAVPQQSSGTFICKNCHRQYSSGGTATKIGLVCPSCYQGMIKRCCVCKNIIRGTGQVAGGNYYCLQCAEKIRGGHEQPAELKCMKCSRPIPKDSQYVAGRDADGKDVVYCVSCARSDGGVAERFKCVKCNRVIEGSNYKSDRDPYGNFIYTCALCATGNDRLSDGTPCTVCGKTIEDSFYYTGVNHRPYCTDCREKYKDRCKSCGLPLPNGQGVKNGSYLTCDLCSKDIVVTEAQLHALYDHVRRYVKYYFGMEVPLPPQRVMFSDKAEMAAKVAETKNDGVPRDYGTNPIGLFSRRGGIETWEIRVQKGMPKLNILSTLIHEYGHACQAYYGKRCEDEDEADYKFSEGFARWFQFKFLSSLGETEYYVRHAKDDDPIYGEGLRKMLELERKITGKGILNYIKDHHRFEEDEDK